MIITTKVEIPPRRIADLMVTAIEGGINYWCKEVVPLRAHGVFVVGETYQTVAGNSVQLIGVSGENKGHETMYDIEGVHRYTARDFGRVTGTQDDPCSLAPPIWYDQELIYSGTPLLIRVKEHDPSSNKNKKGEWFIGLDEMEKAFYLMQEYGRPKGFHFRNFIDENDDAETADVWFQLAVFGEVVYG